MAHKARGFYPRVILISAIAGALSIIGYACLINLCEQLWAGTATLKTLGPPSFDLASLLAVTGLYAAVSVITWVILARFLNRSWKRAVLIGALSPFAACPLFLIYAPFAFMLVGMTYPLCASFGILTALTIFHFTRDLAEPPRGFEPQILHDRS